MSQREHVRIGRQLYLHLACLLGDAENQSARNTSIDPMRVWPRSEKDDAGDLPPVVSTRPSGTRSLIARYSRN